MRQILLVLISWFFVSCVYSQEQWGGSRVQFTSSTVESKSGLVIPAVLWKPYGTPKGGVVLVHGSNGWHDYHEGFYGQTLSRAGYMVLAFDSFTPRGVTSTVARQGTVGSAVMTRDAFAAHAFLVEQGIPSERIALIGFSLGGVVALNIADKTFFPDEKSSYSVTIAYYPGCVLHPVKPKPVTRLLLILGEKDDWTGSESCKLLADNYKKAGGEVQVNVYPGATHGFDGHPDATRVFHVRDAETYTDCRLPVEPDGIVVSNSKRLKFPDDDAAITASMQGVCTKRGSLVWTNTKQKAVALQDVTAYLDTALKN
jgi:dienelactone hydrolase